MQEINKVLATEINPTLDRLRGEKKHYMKWSANNTEVRTSSMPQTFYIP
jgi:structural maintenance of chromosome 2